MSRADYAHWNEDADYVWWQEEGRHDEAQFNPEPDDEPDYSADDCYAEELGEMEVEDLFGLLEDEEYLARWPKALPMIEWELGYRGWDKLANGDFVPYAPSEQSSGL